MNRELSLHRALAYREQDGWRFASNGKWIKILPPPE
jgi:hypothetical protein